MFDSLTVISLVWAAVSVIMSVAAFIAFGVDKRRAEISGGLRLREKTLLALTVYGGAIGAALGRAVFRHKTQKVYFSVVIGISLLCQLSVSILLILRMAGILR